MCLFNLHVFVFCVSDIKKKLERLNGLWNEVQKATNDRGRSLEEALALAEKFWSELQAVMATLRDLQDNLNSQEPPAVEPKAIQQQQIELREIKKEMDQTKPDVEQCRASGQKLMKICGEPDKPEVKKHIEDLDSAWDNVTALFAKREENLIHAMEKAMEFHETLQVRSNKWYISLNDFVWIYVSVSRFYSTWAQYYDTINSSLLRSRN